MSVSAPSGQFFSLQDTGLPVSQGTLMAQWLDAMQTAFPGVTFSTSDPLYVHALVMASWRADLGQLASAGSMELFRQFGTQLLGLAYEQGTPALAILTVTAADTAGHTLPQGTQFTLTLNGVTVAFASLAPLTIASGQSSGTVTVAAVQSGSAYNGAGSPAALVSQIDWVSSVTVLTTASGGVDQESDDAYVQRLAQTLAVLGVATATAGALATRALDFTPQTGTDQQEVGRAAAIDGYSPGTDTFTVTTTSGSDSLTVTAAPGTGITAAPGASITGTGIPSGTIVTASTSSTITMSQNATASGSGVSASVTGTLGNERTVTVCITDTAGNALNADTITAVGTYLAGFREANFVINVVSPSDSTVYVACTVVPQPGYTTATVQANVQAALLSYLSPSNFPLPQGAIQGWQNTQTVYLSALTAVVQGTLGVASVVPGTLAVGLSASPTNTTADLVLPGAFPLPTSTSTSIPTSAITVS